MTAARMQPQRNLSTTDHAPLPLLLCALVTALLCAWSARPSFALGARPLAQFRIGLGAVLLLHLHQCRQDAAGALFGDGGVLSPRVFQDVEMRWDLNPRFAARPSQMLSFDTWSAAWEWALFLDAVRFMCYGALLLGYRTSAATVASYVMRTSYMPIHLVRDGGEQTLHCCLFWAMFLPMRGPWLGGWSLDSRLQRVQAKGAEQSRGAAAAALQPDPVRGLPAACYVCQISLIYTMAGLCKLSDPNSEWVRGTTIAQLVAPLTGMNNNLLTPWLASLPDGVLRALTFGCVALELCGGLLLLAQSRLPNLYGVAWTGLVALHAGIGLTLRLGIFPLISLICLLPLLPQRSQPPLLQQQQRRVALRPAARLVRAARPALLCISILLICSNVTFNHVQFWLHGGLVDRRHSTAIPFALQYPLLLSGTYQHWDMFAPRPGDIHQCPLLFCELSNGTRLDLLPILSLTPAPWLGSRPQPPPLPQRVTTPQDLTTYCVDHPMHAQSLFDGLRPIVAFQIFMMSETLLGELVPDKGHAKHIERHTTSALSRLCSELYGTDRVLGLVADMRRLSNTVPVQDAVLLDHGNAVIHFFLDNGRFPPPPPRALAVIRAHAPAPRNRTRRSRVMRTAILTAIAPRRAPSTRTLTRPPTTSTPTRTAMASPMPRRAPSTRTATASRVGYLEGGGRHRRHPE